MPYGIYKIQGAINTAQAWKEYKELRGRVMADGYGHLIKDPPSTSGWKTIDKEANRLRKVWIQAKNA